MTTLENQAQPYQLSDQALADRFAALPAPRITKEQMQSRIVGIAFYKIGEKVTLCEITLDNNFSVRGESACVNPENYDKEVGEHYAYENAFDKLWPLFGFLLAEDQFRFLANAPQATQSPDSEAA